MRVAILVINIPAISFCHASGALHVTPSFVTRSPPFLLFELAVVALVLLFVVPLHCDRGQGISEVKDVWDP